MSQSPPDPSGHITSNVAGETPRPTPTSTHAPKKRLRRVLVIAGVLVVLLLILVALAPMIASLGFVRSIVVGKVNENLNGSVQIGSYSAGWTTGIQANDVKVFDDQGTLILHLNKFTTGLSLLDAAKGKFALGDTVVDVDLVRAEVDSDGTLNYAKLLKSTPKEKGAKHSGEHEVKPTALPEVSGKLTVNYQGTLYQGGSALVQIQPSVAVIDIPSINQAINNDVALKYAVNGGAEGSIHLAGTVSAVKANQVDLDHATADEKVDLTNVDLKTLSALLELLSPSLKLQTEGIATGSLAIKANGTDQLTAGGEIDVARFAAAGAPLKGNDRLAIAQISVPIDMSRTTKDGQPFIEIKHADVLLNGGQLGKITVAASAPQDALLSAAALLPAVAQQALLGNGQASQAISINGTGTATIAASLDVAALATQLPATVGLQKGTQLSQGHLTHTTTLTISKDTARIDTDTKLPDLKGTNDGKPVELSPLDFTAGLAAVGGAAPDVHDLSIHLTSGFASITGGGATLSKEAVSGDFDLAKLSTQASQFVDLDTLLNAYASAGAPKPHVQLSGAGRFSLNTEGDLIKPDGQGKLATALTITGMNASGIGALPPVKLTNLTATLSGDLHRSASTVDYKNFVAALSAAGVTVAAVDASALPILDNETISANIAGDASVPLGNGPQTIKLATIEVKSSSNLFDVTADSKTDALNFSSQGGSFKADGAITVGADLKKLNDLVQRLGTTRQLAQNNAGPGDLQSGRLDGKLTLSRGNDPQTNVAFDGAITNLTVTTTQKPISNETIKLTLHAINPDDKSLLKADASLDSRFISAKLSDAQLKLAKPAGTWDILQQANIDLNIPDLSAVYEILNAFSPPAAAQASALAPQMDHAIDHNGARIITVALDSTDAETPDEAARRRKREKAERAAKAKPAIDTPVAAIPPLQIAGGSAVGKITLHRDGASKTTVLNVSDFSMSKLAIARGDSKYAFTRNVDFKLAASVQAFDDGKNLSPVQQIQQAQVTQLSGDLGVATLTMPQSITISSPGDSSKIDAQGSIKVDGTLGDAAPLLAVLQGSPKPLPYGGTYDLSQVLRTGNAGQGKFINLTGGVGVKNFQVLDDGGKAVYTEPTVTVKNDVDYILGKAATTTAAMTAAATNPADARSADQAIVRSLTVDMPTSQALAVKFAGRVVDPMNKRIIKGIDQAPAARLDVNYDLEKLWPIVKPTLADDIQTKYKDLKVVGKEQRTFNVSGYFPAAKTVAESMHHLNADGGLALEELDLPQGLMISKFDLPFKMTAGVLQTAPGVSQQSTGSDTTQPIIAKTAVCNDGAVDLSEITLDMGQPSPVLGIAKNHKLLEQIRVNPVLADSLGAGNALFKDASQATGLLDVTIVQCDKVPLGDLIARRNDANAQILYSVTNLVIDGPAPQVLSSILPLGGQGLRGGIQNGKLTLTNGEVNNDFAFNVVRYKKADANGQTDSTDAGSDVATDSNGNKLVPVNMPMKFSGGVTLATGALKNFLVNIPQGLLPAKWASLFPNGLAVPFTGNTSHPNLDIEKAVAQNAGAGLLGGGGKGSNPGDLLKGLLKKKKKTSSDGSSDSSP